MFMRQPVPQHAPRQTYRDIADAFDRMGNFNPGLFMGNPAMGNPVVAAAMMQGLTRNDLPSAPAGIDAATWAQMVQCVPPPPLACNIGCCPPPAEVVSRVTLVGFPKICIPGCDCETVETSVCGPFTLTNLFIPAKIASCLSITRFRIGCWDLLVNCDPVPAELFSCCDLDDNMFAARPVDANSPICLTVENDCKADIPFEGAIKGLLCEPC